MMRSILALAALLLMLPLPGSAAADLSVKKLVVALKPDKDPDQMIEERKSLETFLSDQLGKPVQVIIPLSSSVILEGFANGTIDLAYLSSTDMVHARKRRIADLLLAGEIEGRNAYESYWVSLKEKPYDSVEDLEGKRIAFSSRTSTSGYVVPVYDLHLKGLLETPDAEQFFGEGNVWFGTGYVSAIEKVLSGDAEAAAVSYYVLDKDKHLTAEQRAKLKKVVAQGPVPTHVIAVRASIPEADQARLRQALEALNTSEHTALRDKLFTSKLVQVDPEAHLQPLAAALAFVSGAE